MDVPPDLVRSCKRGDPGAFDELVKLTHRAVYGLAFRILGNAEDAADVTQEVFIRVWRSIGSFRGDAQIGSWVYRITANTALTHVKRRQRAGYPVDPSVLPERPGPDTTESADDARALELALGRLPVEQRAVIVMKDVYGMTCEEIGKEMGSTEGAIKVRLFRARQRLADELATAGVVVPMKRKKTS